MKAFTFGKYYPFHKGHVALIQFALDHCDELSIFVCASDKESIHVQIRVDWINESFKGDERVKVIPFEYKENELPNSSIPSREISKAWAEAFIQLIPDAELLITSEKYGDYVAEFMNIKHLYFDQERKHVPISATELRKSTYENWDFLPDSVKPFYQKSVGFLGTESTGKSSISKALSDSYNSVLVTEVGRDIIPDSNEIHLKDLLTIAEYHAQNILKAKSNLTPLIFVDTDVFITLSYAKYKFGEFFELADTVLDANKLNHRFYLTAETLYEQDGTRLPKEERDKLDESHRSTLAEFNVTYEEVSGSWSDRLIQIEQRLKQLI